MNPDFPQNPRDELEASLTALILGELPADQAFTLGRAIERDAELSKLYERLKRTIELVRQTAASPTEELVSQSAPLKMGDQRRQQLLAHFKTVAPKQFAAPPRRRTRWLVPLAAAAAVLFLAAITIPNFIKAKTSAQSNSIINNLRQLDGAKQQWALENGKSANDVPTLSDLIPFMGRGGAGLPQPVMGETYVVGRVGEPVTAELDTTRAKKAFKGLAVTQPAPGKAGKRVRLSPDGQLAFVDKNTIVDRVAEQPTLGYLTSGGAPAPSGAAPAAAGPIGATSAESEAFRRRYGLAANPVSGQRGQTGTPSEPSVVAFGGTANPSLGAIVLPPSADFADAEKKPALQEQALVLGQRPEGANFFDNDGRGLPVNGEAMSQTSAEPSRDRAGVDSVSNPQWTTGLEKPGQQTPTRNPFIYRDGYLGPAAITAGDLSNIHSLTVVGYTQVTNPINSITVPGQPATPGLQNQGGGGGGGGGGVGGGFAPPRQSAAGQETLQFSHQAAVTTPPTDSASATYPGTSLPLSAGIDPATGLPVAPAIDPTTGLPVTVNNQTAQVVTEEATVQGARPKQMAEQLLRRRSVSVKGGTTQKEAEDNKSAIVGDSPKLGKMFGADQTNSGALQAGRSKLEIPASRDASNLAWGTLKSGVDAGEDKRADRYNGDTLYRNLQHGPSNPKDVAQKASGSIVLPTQETATTAPHEEKRGEDARPEQRKELAMAEAKVIEARLAEQEIKVREAQAKADSLRKESESQQADVAIRKPATNAPIPQPEAQTRDNPFSTFSLNVSDVSFKLAAASLEKGVMPDPASVRSEEFINAFDYRDPEPPPGVPIAFAWERARYPFAQNRDLLRFSIKTAAQGRQAGRPLNIVLLLDNSGSMERADRVGIIHEALKVLAAQLQTQDILSVVTFARTARLWVDGVSGDQAAKVAEEVSNLTPQGGTNLEDAMNLAYQTALRHYLANGINRVVLLTDGAANLGNVEPEALKQKVETNRKQGVALDCFGIGWEGYNDDLLEVLSRNGDGRYGFINTPEEAATEFAGQLAGALRVAASDVKVQVEFNPGRVTAYRQIGYAKHQLTKEQFRDNTVDAAEIGAAESGNALYLIEANPGGTGPLGMVRVRYKVPGTADYREQEWAVPYSGNAVALEQASPALRLAATASAFSEWLVASPYAGEVTPDRLLGYLSGVPEVYGADARPKKLEWMIRQANSIAGK